MSFIYKDLLPRLPRHFCRQPAPYSVSFWLRLPQGFGRVDDTALTTIKPMDDDAPVMKATISQFTSVVSILIASATGSVFADTPLGWLNRDFPSAYTQTARTIDLQLGAIAVNETLDVLNIRDDILAGTRRLEGKSGDLDGYKVDLQVGITSSISAFYRRQEQSLVVDLGEVNSVELTALDDSLDTTSTTYGFKWNFFESGYFDNASAWHAASLEVARVENRTQDFTGKVKRLKLDTIEVTFTNPQEFRLENLEDEGWSARLLYSFPLNPVMTTTVWAGYSESDSTSGTNSDISVEVFKQAFLQAFSTEENLIKLGAGLNWQLTPRIPLQVSYEYLRINKSDTVIEGNSLNSALPSFLRGNNLTDSSGSGNHTVQGSLSYWLTPNVNFSLSAKVFSNQFLGVLPHFNNPLSGSFSDKPYGYAGFSIGIVL